MPHPETITASGIEFFDIYQRMLVHQLEHDGVISSPLYGEAQQPSWTCIGCVRDRRTDDLWEHRELRQRFSFAVPNINALDTIAKYSPNGVVEIGAGGGYWAMLLQQRGVDVVAYDPAPPGVGESSWHSGKAWTAVHVGDHTKVVDHPHRTLLSCWPSYDEPWAAQALELYQGGTVIYIGEGSSGCTADDRFHALVGEEPYCWHHDDDYNDLPCPDDCLSTLTPLFEQVVEIAIPQWAGLHDYLRVYNRRLQT